MQRNEIIEIDKQTKIKYNLDNFLSITTPTTLSTKEGTGNNKNNNIVNNKKIIF